MVVLVVNPVDAAMAMQLDQMSPQSNSCQDFSDDEGRRDRFGDLAETSIKNVPNWAVAVDVVINGHPT